MKQKDIALIIVVVIVSGVVSFFVSRLMFNGGSKKMEAEVVDAISSEFEEPSKTYFNAQSVNPTQLIQIGDSTNQQPL